MSRGINKVILIGNLGADPEMRYMPNGAAVANLSVATSESWKDKQSGEQQQRTDWHRVVAFRRLAEVAGEYMRKGSKVFIEGKIRYSKWQDQSGQDRYSTEIWADNIQMLDRQGEYAGGAGAPMGQQQQPTESGAPVTAGSNAPAEDFDDDIPF